MTRAVDIYIGSDGEATREYYRDLAGRGSIGIIAMNLFRAQKCSSRAKVYRGGIRGRGSYKSMAYERKEFSMQQLALQLSLVGADLGIRWGWKQDSKTVFGGRFSDFSRPSWVLYVDIPLGDGKTGQVSFHSPTRGEGPDYPAEWDGERKSQERILEFCDAVYARMHTSQQELFTTESQRHGENRGSQT